MSSSERVVYLNGQFLPESQGLIHFRDRGFLYGDAVFDTARTFNGRVFKLKEHIDRLYASCQYMRLDPGMGKEQIEELTIQVLDHNAPLLEKNEDYWVSQRISRGHVDEMGADGNPSCTVLIECRLIPFGERGKYYRTGIPAITPSIPRTPPRFMSPRAKTHNYINLILGELEVQEKDPRAWPLVLDERGNLAESRGSNVFIVKDGVVATSKEQFVLPGITRATVIDLATGLGIPVEERDIDLYDAYTAQEIFFTSTTFCIYPTSSLNGKAVGDGKVPGPITERLMGAFSDLVGMDYEAQYLAQG